MIKVVSYGMGNTASIINLAKKSGKIAELCKNEKELDDASLIILPGVGSFDNAVRNLNNSGLLEAIKKKILVERIPFLGICLGMQLLFTSSEEGDSLGLGIIKGHVKKFDFSKELHFGKIKVPHMGWNKIIIKKKKKLFNFIDSSSYFYFFHSYHVICENEEDILTKTDHGYNFVSSIKRENIWGVQFHPEKSHKNGISFFKNFLKEVNLA